MNSLRTLSDERLAELDAQCVDGIVVEESPFREGVIIYAAELDPAVKGRAWVDGAHCGQCGWLADHRLAKRHESNGAPTQDEHWSPRCSRCAPHTAKALKL